VSPTPGVVSPIPGVVSPMPGVVEGTIFAQRSPGSPQTAFGSLTQADLHESKFGAIPLGHTKGWAMPNQQR
jgi:hypothetical protein